MVGSAKPSEIKNSTPGIGLNFWNPLAVSRDNIDNTLARSQFPSLHSESPLLSSYPKIELANNTIVSRDRAEWAMSSQTFICGCQAQCKGLQKPVSLSTFNRHRKYRDAESFSTEFRGFLESSSAVPALMGSQLEVIFYNNSSDSNLTNCICSGMPRLWTETPL